MPLCGGAKSDAKVWWPLSLQNVYVLAITSLASEYLPTGLGAQIALPTLVSSGMELVGEAGAGGGGGGVVDDVEVDDVEVDDVEVDDVEVDDFEVDDVEVDDFEVDDVDLLDDVGRLDEDADDVVPGVLRTWPGCKSLMDIPGFAASRAATGTPCSAAILARVSPG